MQGTYLLAALILIAFIVDQDTTTRVLTTVSLKMQWWWINWCAKRHAHKLHRKLSADMKKDFGIELPEFEWVDLWERDR